MYVLKEVWRSRRGFSLILIFPVKYFTFKTFQVLLLLCSAGLVPALLKIQHHCRLPAAGYNLIKEIKESKLAEKYFSWQIQKVLNYL